MLPSRLDGFERQSRGRLAERGKYSARVKPTGAEFAKDLFPIEVTRAQLARGSVTPVGCAQGAPDPEPAFGEVQSVTNRAPDSVKGAPLDKLRIDPALQNKVFHEVPDLVVGKTGADGGLQAEAPAKAASHIIFAAAFPNLEMSRGPNPALARVKPEHDLAQSDQVIAARGRRFKVQSA